MNVIGVDFTSRPTRRKTITCVHCVMDAGTLRAERLEGFTSFAAFEDLLTKPGPWVAGFDFPFGQSRTFIENIRWPLSWSGYVDHAAKLGRDGFRHALLDYKKSRELLDKEHRRATDKAMGSISPQKLFGVPVALMFFEGAPRLLAAGVTIPHVHDGDPGRIVVEAYPGVLARNLIGDRSYKSDTRRKQTADQHAARLDLMAQLLREAPTRYGFSIETQLSVCDDPGADDLDALLCAVQAAWAWSKRDDGYGAPAGIDCLEGWIAHPDAASRRADADARRTRELR